MTALENPQEGEGSLTRAGSHDQTDPQSPSSAQVRARSPEQAGFQEGPADYETSVARVEQIIHRLDTGEASLSETLDLVREGKGLIERCAQELEAVGGALEELRLEDLVARLESEGPQNGTGESSG